MWSEILTEIQTKSKFENKKVLVIGKRNSGKRTFFDNLHNISGTVFPQKSK